MNPLISRLAREASAPLEDMLARLIRTAVLIVLAACCAIAASVFLTIDLYLFIESRTNPLVAGASVGGLYLIFALIFLLVALRRPAHPQSSDAAVVNAPVQHAAKAPFAAASVGAHAAPPPPRNPAFAANIDAAAAPVLNALRDSGLDKEILAIEAGVEVAKQLNPFSLVAFAVGAGLILGRTLRAKRKLF
ncbi:MAG: hypothetical protein ACLPSF_07765 [Methylocella sp.]